MIKGNTVFVVVRTLSVETSTAHGGRTVDAMPIIEGVFDSYDAANVTSALPLLDDKPEYVAYSIIEREIQ
jgi:hypothetical protein